MKPRQRDGLGGRTSLLNAVIAEAPYFRLFEWNFLAPFEHRFSARDKIPYLE
jgi:hypothetical protein